MANRRTPTDEERIDTLQRAIEWMQAARPVSRIPYVERTNDGRIVLSHPHLAGTDAARRGIDPDDALNEDGSPSADFHVLAVRALADIRRRTARMADLAAAGDGSPVSHDDRGRPSRVLPDWAYLVHPLLGYAIARSRGALRTPGDHRLMSGPGDRPGTFAIEHDLLLGGLSFGGARVGANARSLSVTTLEPLPTTLAQALVGEPLSALVELPPCGLADVDAAVAALVIRSIREDGGTATLANGQSIGPFPTVVSFLLKPTPWIRVGPDPDGIEPTYDRLFPYAI